MKLMPVIFSGFSPVLPQKQRGAVLFIALVFLILLTLVAVAGSNTSMMQERMVGGLRNMQMATAGAESGLREAEAKLWNASATNQPIFSGASGANGAYTYSASAPNANVTTFRSSPSSSIPYGYSTYQTVDLTAVSGTGKLASNPTYLIEDLGVDTPPGNANPKAQKGYNGLANTGALGGATNHIFRISARSAGGSSTTLRAVESTFSANANGAPTSIY